MRSTRDKTPTSEKHARQDARETHFISFIKICSASAVRHPPELPLGCGRSLKKKYTSRRPLMMTRGSGQEYMPNSLKYLRRSLRASAHHASHRSKAESSASSETHDGGGEPLAARCDHLFAQRSHLPLELRGGQRRRGVAACDLARRATTA